MDSWMRANPGRAVTQYQIPTELAEPEVPTEPEIPTETAEIPTEPAAPEILTEPAEIPTELAEPEVPTETLTQYTTILLKLLTSTPKLPFQVSHYISSI